MLLPVFVLMVHSPSQRTSSRERKWCCGGVATEEQLVCSDGTAPDVTTGLCADGSQPQPQGQAPENVSGAALVV